MKRGWLIATSLLALACATFAYESIELKLYDSIGPGSGFFPFWLGLLGTALSLGLIWQLITGRTDLGDETLAFERAGVRQVGSIIAILAIAAVLLEPLGFRLTMLAMITALLFVLGIRSVAVITCFALGGSFGVYHVFSIWLKVPLPTNAFGV